MCVYASVPIMIIILNIVSVSYIVHPDTHTHIHTCSTRVYLIIVLDLYVVNSRCEVLFVQKTQDPMSSLQR